jgi:hypothetical protein
MHSNAELGDLYQNCKIHDTQSKIPATQGEAKLGYIVFMLKTFLKICNPCLFPLVCLLPVAVT